jgi:arginine/lysine/ornithine decarboxylase
MLAPRETLPLEKAVGRILADACVSCPPAVPVVIAGERITKEAAACMAYYGVTECEAVKM